MEAFDLRKWTMYQEASGKASEPFLVDQVVVDSRRISSKHALFVALSGANFDGHAFLKHAFKAGARVAIIKKDFQGDAPSGMQLLRVDEPLRALQQIAAAYRMQMGAKVIAITGSYGKTMLKDLLHHLISSQYETLFKQRVSCFSLL